MYRTICAELWTDPEIKALDVPTKLLFIYLITNPHTHLSGIYYLPLTTLFQETGIKPVAYRAGMDELTRLDKAYCDLTTETMFVKNMFSRQGRGPKNRFAAAHQLTQLHRSPLIIKFLQRYPEIEEICISRHYCSWIRYPIDTLSHTLSIPYPSLPVPDSSSEESSSLNSLNSPNPRVVKDLEFKKGDPLKNGVETWNAYLHAYQLRYHVDPVRNQQVNSQLKQLVGKLGHDEAPLIASFYLTHNKPLYVSARHPTNLLLRDATGLRTEWATGIKATTSEVKAAEQRDDAHAQIARVRAKLEGRAGNGSD